MPIRRIFFLLFLLCTSIAVNAQLTDSEDENEFIKAKSYCDSANELAHKSRFTEAIAMGQKAVDEYIRLKYRKKKYLGLAMTSLASYYSQRQQPGDIDKAIGLIEGCQKSFSPKSEEFVIAEYNLLSLYDQQGNLQKVAELKKRLAKAKTSVFANNPLAYASIMNTQAGNMARSGNYQAAVGCALQAAHTFEENKKDSTLEYCKLMLNVSTFYSKLQKYDESLSILKKVAPLLCSLEGAYGTNYQRCLRELSDVTAKMGNLEEADDYMQKTITNYNDKDAINPTNAKGLAKAAEVFSRNGNYAMALSKSRESLEMFYQLGNPTDIAQGLNDLSSYFNNIGQLDSAVIYCDSSLVYYNRCNATSSRVSALFNMTKYKLQQGDYDGASAYGNQAEALCVQYGDTISQLYSYILSTQGLVYFRNGEGDLLKAYQTTEKAQRIFERLFGPENPDNVMFLFNMAIYAYYRGDVAAVQKNFHRALEMQTAIVRANFSHLPAAQRENFWNTKKSVFTYAQAFSTLDGISDTLASDIYDALLFTKSILLNSEIDFRTLLQKSATPEIQSKYEQLTILGEGYKSLQSLPNVSQKELDEFKYRISLYRRDIVKACKQFGDFTANMEISTSDVAASLGDDEVAMEIFDVDVAGGGREYIAMYLRKGWKSPRVVRLFNLAEINALPVSKGDFQHRLHDRYGINQLFSDKEITDLVWSKLRAEWEGVNKVFFAPSGVFYQWGVEYLMCEDGSRMIDHYDFHRLTSTKLLCQRTEDKSVQHATIFGGLDFDATPEQIILAEQERAAEQETYDALDESKILAMLSGETETADSIDTRDVGEQLLRGARVEYLPGTYLEARAIHKLFLQGDITADLYTGRAGSEDAFRSLSGSDTDLIHVATHGFSLNDLQSRSCGDLFIENDNMEETDKSLEYSGLLFAGAQNAFNHTYPIPSGRHNGVLTAREISQMDLSHVRLAVLSACQTGLGQLKEDGVFGLQRGFKKAGVKSLMMSLWTVADDATEKMMTGFYKGLCSGQSVSASFRNAQRQLIEGGFPDPYYWASFILLDQME